MRSSLFVVALVVAACTGPITRPLVAFTGGLECRGVGLDAVLHGDPDDPRVAWLADRTSDLEMEATWPPGVVARFDPDLEIVLDDGTIFYRAGDTVDGGCFTSDGGPWAIKYSRHGTPPT